MDFLVMDATAADVPTSLGMVGGIMQLMPFILIFAVMYFLMIKPQKKKQQEHQKMLENLQVHDKVITSGGMIGKIVNFKKEKNTVVIRVDDNTKIEFQRSAISGVILDENGKKAASN